MQMIVKELLFLKNRHLLERLSKLVDFAYFFKFSFVLIVLFYFHIVFHGLVSPEGAYYSVFLAKYLNYIAAIRFLILSGSKYILYAIGINSYLESNQILRIAHGPGVNVWLPCLGLGIISFWFAIVIAHKANWQRKFLWCTFGFIAISTINCFRIAIFLISLNNNWPQNTLFDHHDLFNLLSYIFIYFLVYCYHKKEHTSHTSNYTKRSDF